MRQKHFQAITYLVILLFCILLTTMGYKHFFSESSNKVLIGAIRWETSWQKPYDGMGKYFALPTPGELAAHLKEAILWTKDRKQVCPAKRVIIYAWNEHDEGGWLCPTIDENDQFNASRLKALKKVLKSIN